MSFSKCKKCSGYGYLSVFKGMKAGPDGMPYEDYEREICNACNGNGESTKQEENKNE